MSNKQSMPNSQKNSLGNADLMWRMLGLARPLTGWMVIAVVCGVAGFCCATGIPVLAAEAALCTVGLGALAWPLGAVVAVLAVMAVARGLLHFIEQRCNHYIAFRLLAHVRDLVFSALRQLTPAKLAGADRGDLISTVTADVELLEVFYAHTISPICIAVLMACAMTAFLGGVAGILPAALALASYVLVGVGVPVCISRASGTEGQHSRNLAGALSSFVLDSLRGLSEVLQFDAGEQRLSELDARSDQLVEAQRKLRGHAGRGQAATTGLIMTLSCLQVLLCLHLAQAGSISAEGAVLASVATFSSFGPFVALANLGSTLQGTLAAGRRVIAILDETPQVNEVSDKDGAHPGFSGIAAKNVDFSYDDEQILDNVSIQVAPGQIVGIQGRSGSGKSTLCRLFMRFWDVDKGCVALSGHDVREVATSALRDSEAFVEQDTHLFHGSIRDNLLIAKPNASNQELEEACRAASVHDFIMSLPSGYDSMVGELGDTLSGGERQRLGLARAFLHDAPLLLLDEPTSNLDSLNEGQIMRTLTEQRGKRAVMLISHRPSTMSIADKTYSMDSGRVS
mgnify:CR=1 FL=1